MNVIELLKQQHEEVQGRARANDRGGRRERVPHPSRAALQGAAPPHADRGEDGVSGGDARLPGDEDDEENMLESYEEHAVAAAASRRSRRRRPATSASSCAPRSLKEIFESARRRGGGRVVPRARRPSSVRTGSDKLGDLVERRCANSRARRARSKGVPVARRGQPGHRGRRASAARATRPTRATSGARGRASKAAAERREREGARSDVPGEAARRESFGNKPRRGESTSRA